ncbi:alpha-1,4-galacturonosyltransferase 1-like protein [Corchorus capsularis]|uniref:Alpha-1,4-galacturonosyltransferase 1-like protein n=1 Tax=Corchorus capsularis TaxID=210143 RepID=A0A1R3I7S1_COCAP|nr:alpha-1,4-galacturonosyltransferase 1-like protein [Corchorus capsularis]
MMFKMIPANRMLFGLWREMLALQFIRNLFTKEVINFVTTSTTDTGPLILDSFRKANLSALWKIIGVESSVEDNASSESNQKDADLKQETPQVKEAMILDAIEQSKAVDSAVLSKCNTWRKEHENDNPDSTVRLMRDKIIMTKAYNGMQILKAAKGEYVQGNVRPGTSNGVTLREGSSISPWQQKENAWNVLVTHGTSNGVKVSGKVQGECAA